jgi:hypothetical protein
MRLNECSCYNNKDKFLGAGIAQSVYRLATGWAVPRLNLSGGEIFRVFPNRPWGLLSLL